MSFNQGPSARRSQAPSRTACWRPGFLAITVTVALLLAACGGNRATNKPTSAASSDNTPGSQVSGSTPTAGAITGTTAPQTEPTSAQPGDATSADTTPAGQVTTTPDEGQNGQPPPAGETPPAAKKKVDRTKPAAVVNGESITFEQLDTVLEARYGSQLMQQMILETLIKQEAKKRKITISDAEVKGELKKAQDTVPGQDIEQVIKQQSGLSLEDFKDQLRLRLYIQKMLAPQLKVSDQEAKAYFDSNRKQFETPQELKVLRVVADDQAKAAAAAKELKAGKQITDVVKKYGSKQPGRAEQNGDTGFIPADQLGPDLQPVVSGLKAGQVSEPAPLQSGGFAVVKLEASKGGDVPALDKVKPKVVEAVQQQKLNQIAPQFVDSLRSKAKIQTQLEDQSSAPPAGAPPGQQPGAPQPQPTPSG